MDDGLNQIIYDEEDDENQPPIGNNGTITI